MTESSDAPKKGPSQRDRERFSNRRAALAAASRPIDRSPDLVEQVAEKYFTWLEEVDKT